MNNIDRRPLVAPSSIALLQQRFRDLHRVKQMREERELLKLLSLSSHTLLHFPTAVGTFFWRPELMMITAAAAPPRTSLSLSPISQPHKVGAEVAPLVDLWPAPDAINACDDRSTASDDNIDDSDSCSEVDTSLHL